MAAQSAPAPLMRDCVYERIRNSVHAMIVERASIAGLVETASDAQLQALDTFRKAPKGTDLGRWISCNREFHLAAAAATGNVRLARAARDVLEQFDRLTFMSVAASRGKRPVAVRGRA